METEGKKLQDIDRSMGHFKLCGWCGFVWSAHHCTDNSCPGTRIDGSIWPMQYAPNLSPGTTYKEGEHDGN